jgi:predicted DNA-binding transcriptional regulator AlpA
MGLHRFDDLVDLKGVLAALSVKSRSSYYKYAKNPNFPRAVRVNGDKGPLKFKAREVAQFIDSLNSGER